MFMRGAWLYSYLALWGLVLLQAFLVLSALRQIGVLLLRMGPRPALDVGEGASGPEFGQAAPSAGAAGIELNPLGGNGFAGSVMIFTSPTCGSCVLIPQAVSSLVNRYREVAFVVAANGPERAIGEYRNRFPAAVKVIREDGQLSDAYRIRDVPYAVFTDAAGLVVQKGIVNNREHLEELVKRGLALARLENRSPREEVGLHGSS